jgi:hypothetical protein
MRSTLVRKAQQNRSSSRRLVRSVSAVFSVSAALLGAIGVWSFFAQRHPTVMPEGPTVSSITRDENPITIIISSPNRNDCRRYRLDKAGGAISEKSTGDCDSDSGGGQGTRIEAIAKGFRNK